MDEDFDLPSKMQKMRKDIVSDRIRSKISISSTDLDHLLRGINKDVYDTMDDLEEWNSLRTKILLNFNLGLTYVFPNRENFRDMIFVGKRSVDLSVDNYRRVLTAVDFVHEYSMTKNIYTLIDQLYYAETHARNCLYYMDDLKVKINTKYYDCKFNERYVKEMENSREKVLSLEKNYVKGE